MNGEILIQYINYIIFFVCILLSPDSFYLLSPGIAELPHSFPIHCRCTSFIRAFITQHSITITECQYLLPNWWYSLFHLSRIHTNLNRYNNHNPYSNEIDPFKIIFKFLVSWWCICRAITQNVSRFKIA